MPLPAALAFGTAAMGTLGDIWGASQQAAGTRAMANAMIQGQREAIKERKAGYQDVAGTRDANGNWSGGLQSNYMNAGEQALGRLTDPGMQTSVPWQRFGNKDANGQSYEVGNYLDPSMQFQQDEMRKNMEASAAAGGPGLRSGAFAQELQNRGAQLAQTDYANSWNRMNQDRAFGYQDYLNKYQQQRQQVQDDMGRWTTLLASGQGAANLSSQARTGVANSNADSYGAIGGAQGVGAAAGYNANAVGIQSFTDPSFQEPFAAYMNSTFGGGGQQAPQVQQPGAQGLADTSGMSMDPNNQLNRTLGNVGVMQGNLP